MVFSNQFKRKSQYYARQSAQSNELLQCPEYINYFKGVRERQIKRLFSMVRKQFYVCEAFISRPIKNSTSGGQWQNKMILKEISALRLAKCQINRAFRLAANQAK